MLGSKNRVVLLNGKDPRVSTVSLEKNEKKFKECLEFLGKEHPLQVTVTVKAGAERTEPGGSWKGVQQL